MVQKSHAVKSAMFDLVGSLGDDRVTKESKAITGFASDMSGAHPKRANLVARPDSPAQAREVVLIAGRFGLPLIPVVGKSNASGLTVPDDGGVILDLRDLKGIHGVNHEDMHVEIEAGVSWQELHDYLAEHAPGLRFGYTLAPPESSVIAGCLFDATLDLSLRHGASSAWINGVEAVLANGDWVHTGVGAVVDNSFANTSVPDLTSLFINTFGTLGVVTRATLQLWPNPDHRSVVAFRLPDLAGAVALQRALAREDVCDDVLLSSWAAEAVLGGQDGSATMDPPSGSSTTLFARISAQREALFTAKRACVDDIAAELSAGAALDIEALRASAPATAGLADSPVRLSALLDHEGGGLVWSSAVGPTSSIDAALDRGMRMLVDAGFPPLAFSRACRGGHHGEISFVLKFDKKNFEQKKVVTDLQPALAEAMVDCGFFPCRASGPTIERLKDRFDAGFRKMFLNIRKVLDPGAIMNPGRWELEGRFTRESVVLAKPRTEKPEH